MHVEVANSLEPDALLNAFKRFKASRGAPEEIKLDNGTNFKGGERELKVAIQNWNQSQVHSFFLQRKIEWIYSTHHTHRTWMVFGKE